MHRPVCVNCLCSWSPDLDKVDGYNSSSSQRVLGQVPEYDVTGLQHSELLSTGEREIVRVLSWSWEKSHDHHMTDHMSDHMSNHMIDYMISPLHEILQSYLYVSKCMAGCTHGGEGNCRRLAASRSLSSVASFPGLPREREGRRPGNEAISSGAPFVYTYTLLGFV